MEYLVGSYIDKALPVGIFDDTVCDFLDDLAKELRADSEAKRYPDVLSFAFFCRKGNVHKLREAYAKEFDTRIGRGLSMHIAPGNVPVNFAFSYIFGLLSGNACVVRVSEKPFPQVDIICRAINKVVGKKAADSDAAKPGDVDSETSNEENANSCNANSKTTSDETINACNEDFGTKNFLGEGRDYKYDAIRQRTAIVRYGKNKETNDLLSSKADVRVIWGGDTTIRTIQQSPTPTRCKDIVFADRYSVGVIDVKALVDADDAEVARLAQAFYNDTYLMDQNACSTPHMIFWVKGKSGNITNAAHVENNCNIGKTESNHIENVYVTDNASATCKLDAVDSEIDWQIKSVQERFWQAVYQEAKAKYDLADIKVSDKYTALCELAAKSNIKLGNVAVTEGVEKNAAKSGESMVINGNTDSCMSGLLIDEIKKWDNLLYVVSADNLPSDIPSLRGRFGMFYQTVVDSVEDIMPYMGKSVQSVMYYGCDRTAIIEAVKKHHALGVDRVVPFGKSLDIGMIWDGYDLIREMSRVIG